MAINNIARLLHTQTRVNRAKIAKKSQSTNMDCDNIEIFYLREFQNIGILNTFVPPIAIICTPCIMLLCCQLHNVVYTLGESAEVEHHALCDSLHLHRITCKVDLCVGNLAVEWQIEHLILKVEDVDI